MIILDDDLYSKVFVYLSETKDRLILQRAVLMKNERYKDIPEYLDLVNGKIECVNNLLFDLNIAKSRSQSVIIKSEGGITD